MNRPLYIRYLLGTLMHVLCCMWPGAMQGVVRHRGGYCLHVQ